jgi:small-conductance mechanosensitive channel
METFDGRDVLLPNEDLITQRLTSWTLSNRRARIDIAVSIAYDANVEKAHDLMLEAATSHPKCLQDPKPLCVVSELADSAVVLHIYFWIADITDGRLEPKSDVIRRILTDFKAAGIEIPFPQRVVHMKAGA